MSAQGPARLGSNGAAGACGAGNTEHEEDDMKRGRERRQMIGSMLGGPLRADEVAPDYVERHVPTDQYFVVLPSGARALLIFPSTLKQSDRDFIQKILDLAPPDVRT